MEAAGAAGTFASSGVEFLSAVRRASSARADPKRNRYTLDVLADDKRVEKRDRSINEPVQFYVSRAHQAYEIVVNEVQKDRVVGYLAVPKVLSASR